LEAAFLQQRQERGGSGGADLLASPAGSKGVRAPVKGSIPEYHLFCLTGFCPQVVLTAINLPVMSLVAVTGDTPGYLKVACDYVHLNPLAKTAK
jgi:hypothetical protein